MKAKYATLTPFPLTFTLNSLNNPFHITLFYQILKSNIENRYKNRRNNQVKSLQSNLSNPLQVPKTT